MKVHWEKNQNFLKFPDSLDYIPTYKKCPEVYTLQRNK